MKAADRKPRAYKISDDNYDKAFKRAIREKGHLANLIENVAICYAYGFEIKAVKERNGQAAALDVLDLDKSEVISASKRNTKK